MSTVGFVIWIVIGGLAGFLASKVISGKGMGVLWDVVVGIAGGILGGWLAGFAGITTANLLMEFVVAFVGALILLAVFRALTHRGILHS